MADKRLVKVLIDNIDDDRLTARILGFANAKDLALLFELSHNIWSAIWIWPRKKLKLWLTWIYKENRKNFQIFNLILFCSDFYLESFIFKAFIDLIYRLMKLLVKNGFNLQNNT